VEKYLMNHIAVSFKKSKRFPWPTLFRVFFINTLNVSGAFTGRGVELPNAQSAFKKRKNFFL